MSAIAGVLSFTRRPPDGAVALAMLDIMAHGAADDIGVFAEGPIAMGHRVRWTTDEAAREHQPIRSASGRRLLSYDGRLDNRDEVAARLALPPTTSDGVLLVELIEREGTLAIAHCVGEFALACWSPHDQRLLLARDSLGMRPLYYALTDDGVIWASDLRAIFVPGQVRRKPNEGFIAEFLADTIHSLDETPFAGVCRLPQASVLEVCEAAPPVRHQYWKPDFREERRIDDREATGEFRRLLTMSVAACGRARQPVAFQVSGGLDSSSIIGLACEAGMRQPSTYSLVYPHSTYADESPFIDEVVRFTDARARRFEPPPFGADVFDYALRHDELPYAPTGEPLLKDLLQAAAADGHRVMLTGFGGDQWLMFSLFRLAQILRRGRVWAAAQYASELRRFLLQNWRWHYVLSAGLLPLLPARLKRIGRPLVSRAETASWMSPAFVRRTHLADRMRASFARAPAKGDPIVRESMARLTSGEEATVREVIERMGSHAGIELRHPFYDRRLVEFLLVLPDRLRFQGGLAKHIVRVAMADVLPSPVKDRVDKASLDDVLIEMVRGAGPLDCGALRSADLGWVDADRVGEMWRRFERARPDNAADNSIAYTIWNLLAVEAWLRHTFP